MAYPTSDLPSQVGTTGVCATILGGGGKSRICNAYLLCFYVMV